jgi:hypothetical protein
MSFERIPETDLQYGLISFDADGNERSEQSGLISETLIRKAATESVTNIFFFCHGWQGDFPGAKEQYSRWLKAFIHAADYHYASQRLPKCRSLFIGLHWPSKPWGDEELRRPPQICTRSRRAMSTIWTAPSTSPTKKARAAPTATLPALKSRTRCGRRRSHRFR